MANIIIKTLIETRVHKTHNKNKIIENSHVLDYKVIILLRKYL